MLEFCKWDPQVGDVSTLADFPLVLSRTAWAGLRNTAEALTRETLAMERRLLERPDLYATLGLPRTLSRVLERSSTVAATPAAARVMRFDFHPTRDGWRVSEVNSDVPGGFAEGSAFAGMVAEHVDRAAVTGDPQRAYVDALEHAVCDGKSHAIALLVAPGFMEDQQVVAGLAQALRQRGIDSAIVEPRQMEWNAGLASVRSAAFDGPVGAIVRFYQGEWLAQLPRRIQWANLFVGGRTPVANPGSAILTESKRLPLVWDELSVDCATWKRLLPETRDPRHANWRSDSSWLLKTAFCNTGDSVTVRAGVPKQTWRRRSIDAWLHPLQWIAQRRMELFAIGTPVGKMFPCVGVYTVNGTACGIYGRISSGSVVNYSAIDVAVLVEQASKEAQNDF